jgi:hypothetical protein
MSRQDGLDAHSFFLLTSWPKRDNKVVAQECRATRSASLTALDSCR